MMTPDVTALLIADCVENLVELAAVVMMSVFVFKVFSAMNTTLALLAAALDKLNGKIDRAPQ